MSCRAGRVDINVLTKIKSIKYSGNVVSRAHYLLLAREDLVHNIHVGPVRIGNFTQTVCSGYFPTLAPINFKCNLAHVF